MAANTTIRSRENPIIKRVGAVFAGLEPGTIVLEGDRLVDDALRGGLALETVLVAEDRAERAEELRARGQAVKLVDPGLLQRTGRLKTSPGVLAICPTPPPLDLSRLALDERSLLLVVAGVADPGNLGALSRSAEAFGATAMLVARGGASPWSEKALRGSMGSLLRMPVGYGLEAEALAAELRARGVRQACAATRGGADPRSFDWRGPIALWIGSETGELPDAARGLEAVTIPMAGAVESLNVAVAAAILLHAAGRVPGGGAGNGVARGDVPGGDGAGDDGAGDIRGARRA